ncbi:MAG: hypothetical protein JO166_05900 [Deltaproteobacteria bacterium]|nr:hypothetical protein [Deltaproteobacteria bacterium]
MLSLLSPVAGMMVELALARRFGTSAPVDAFRVSIAIVHIGQQLFLSVLPCVIVPLFVDQQSNGNEAAAWQSSIELVRLAVIPTSLISLILFAFPRAAVWLLAPGLEAQRREWACFFLRWFSLSLVPLCAEHVRQLAGESPRTNLMEVKDSEAQGLPSRDGV